MSDHITQLQRQRDDRAALLARVEGYAANDTGTKWAAKAAELRSQIADLDRAGRNPMSAQTDRDAVALDPRVQIDGHKEKIAPVDAVRERVAEAERRRNGGGAR